MMKVQVLFISSFIALVNTVGALECYQCNGTKCDTEIKLWEKLHCDASSLKPSHQWVCLKQVYKDRNTYKPAILRTCLQLEVKDYKLTYNCKTDKGEPESCNVCQTNLCNISYKIIPSFLTFLISTIFFIVH